MPIRAGSPNYTRPLVEAELATPGIRHVAHRVGPPTERAEMRSRELPRVMAVANQKGGVGKTTTAVNLGASLADLGHRVLVIDLDPQGNATTGLGVNPWSVDTSMYDVLLKELPIEDCIDATS